MKPKSVQGTHQVRLAHKQKGKFNATSIFTSSTYRADGRDDVEGAATFAAAIMIVIMTKIKVTGDRRTEEPRRVVIRRRTRAETETDGEGEVNRLLLSLCLFAT